jgi:proteasome lid subunit RPN8/RPN11
MKPKSPDEKRSERRPASGEAAEPLLDASRMELSDVPQRDPPPGPPEFRVVIERPVFDAIATHAATDSRLELCGVLVGRLFRDRRGPYLLVSAMIEGKHTRATGAEVTFTQETWNHVHEMMDKEHPDLRIVGWYHTHPGFGVFLSDMDLFIHRHFFNAPCQIAFVYDPLSRAAGVFAWREGEPARMRYYQVGDELRYDESGPKPGLREKPVAETPGPQKDAQPAPAQDSAVDQDDFSFRSLLTPGTLYVAVVLLAVFAGVELGGCLSDWKARSEIARLADESAHHEEQAQQQTAAAIKAELAQMVLLGVFRDGLEERLGLAESRLQRADSVLAAATRPASASAPAEARLADLQGVQSLVDQTRSMLAELRTRYGKAKAYAEKSSQATELVTRLEHVETQTGLLVRMIAASGLRQAIDLWSQAKDDQARKQAAILCAQGLLLDPTLEGQLRSASPELYKAAKELEPGSGPKP